MIARREKSLARAVAVADVQKLAGAIEAQSLDHVARPAAAVAVARQPLLGGKHAVVAIGGNVALEVGLAAKQAKAVLDLPVDAQRRVAALSQSGALARGRHQQRGQAKNADEAHERGQR